MNPGPTASVPWQDGWWAGARAADMRAWRAVEAQHVVATMRLVDTLDEQAMLEQILEGNKPALPPTSRSRHFLLATPFRYRPVHGSRFRRAGAPGVWYGALAVRTACAEVAYWRWRFLMDSAGLRRSELLTEHTVFSAQIQGLAVDLREDPWRQEQDRWTHTSDYTATQALAEAARQHGVQWMAYASVRDPGGCCAVVFDPLALDKPDLRSQQTWHCCTTQDGSRMVHGSDRHEWRYASVADRRKSGEA